MGKHIHVRQHGDRLYYSEPEHSGGYMVKLWTHDDSDDDDGADDIVWGFVAAVAWLLLTIAFMCF